MELHSDEALYLFCFARSDLVQDVEGNGIDGSSPLFLHPIREISAVLSRISLEELGGIERIDDPAWITPRAARHAEVIERVARRSPILPAKFGMLFASMDRLESLVMGRYADILEFLARIDGFEEWSLKAFLNRRKARSRPSMQGMEEEKTLPSQPERCAGPEPSIGLDGDRAAWIDAKKRELCEIFRSRAADLIERVQLPFDTSKDGEELVWNWALLVSKTNREALGRVVDQVGPDLDAGGITLRFAGPWPPYSFAPSLVRES